MLGNLASQLCREAGAFPLLSVDPLPSRVEIAHACGLGDAATGRGEQTASYVIEAVGLAPAFRDALEVFRRAVIERAPTEISGRANLETLRVCAMVQRTGTTGVTVHRADVPDSG